MTNSILIGKLISAKLKENEYIYDLLGDKIYPIIANNKATYPFIVYWKENVLPQYTKDWLTYDTVTFTIVVADTTYEQCLDIAQQVRTIFERPALQTEFMSAEDCHMTDLREEYAEECYVQTLVFECKVFN